MEKERGRIYHEVHEGERVSHKRHKRAQEDFQRVEDGLKMPSGGQ